MATIEQRDYGLLPDGRRVGQYTLRNDNGVCLRFIDHGAITTGIDVPDRTGRVADVVLGFDTLADWLADTRYHGATMGRYANRIAGGEFTIDGERYRLGVNEGGNHLHGGNEGFHNRLWSGEQVGAPNGDCGVRFTLVSPDGHDGYPGELRVSATHWLTDDNTFRVAFVATSDKPTIVNPTHHSYWNLSAGDRPFIGDHELTILADAYTPVGAGNVPTGEIAPVAGTPLDFTTGQRLGPRFAEQPGGFDHNFVLRDGGGTVRRAARLVDPHSGRVVEMLTDAPGMQVYTANVFDPSVIGKRGAVYDKHCAVALEAQSFPDAPNHAAFPNAILRPGEAYRRTIAFRFSIDQ